MQRVWTSLALLCAAAAATLPVALPPAASASPAATTLPAGFGSLAVDPGSSRVFVSSPSSGTVTALDFAGHVVASVGSLAGPGAMVVNGPTLYVALQNGGAIAALDTATLTETGILGSGQLVDPGTLAMAGGLLWTSTGPCTQWTTQLASVDPVTGAVHAYAMPSATSLAYCIGLAAAPQAPNTLLAWDLGVGPATITRFDVSTGAPVVAATAVESDQGNLQQIAVNPDGATFVTASGSPYRFEEFRLSDLGLDGNAYPAYTYPDAVVTTTARGGMVVGGMNGLYNADVVAYRAGSPGSLVYSYDFNSPTNTVVNRGLAISPDGSTLFAVTGSPASSGPTVFNVLPLVNATTTTVSTPSVAQPGSPVTLTATVTATGGFPSPTGTVSFSLDGSVTGTAPVGAGGVATLDVGVLPSGLYSAVAAYSGDPNNQASTSKPAQFDVAWPTSTSLTGSPDPSTVGQPVTFAASVSGGTTAKTGSVTFADGQTVLGVVSVTAPGAASLTTSSLAAGSHSVTAAYSGDTNNAPSTSAAVVQTVKVVTAVTSTSLAANVGAPAVDQPVTFVATVTGASPTGTVVFTDGTTLLGDVALVNGQATLATAFATTGSHVVTAQYQGDAANTTSQASVTESVAPDTSTVSVATSANNVKRKTPVTITATVRTSYGASPSGTVTFYVNGKALASVTVTVQGGSGTASYTTSALPVGTDAITARYNSTTPTVAGSSTAAPFYEVIR